MTSLIRSAVAARLVAVLLVAAVVVSGLTVVASAASASAASTCTISVTVRYGSTGTPVKCVQSRLNTLHYPAGPVDGIFGSVTRNAVMSFQRASKLLADGVVGPKTGAALGIWSVPAVSCTPPVKLPSTARQAVIVTSSGTYARVTLLKVVNGKWTCARSNMIGRVGRNGVRPLAQRRSGDGTTPGGVFPLATMVAPNGKAFQFFGNGANPGVHGGWHQVQAGDCWAATPYLSTYNTLISRSASRCISPDEYLPSITGAYTMAAFIGANTGPARSGDRPGEPPLAAAIFLHRFSYTSTGATKPTSGCVSLGLADLTFVMRSLVAGQAWFVIR